MTIKRYPGRAEGRSRGLSLFSLALIGCLPFDTGCATAFRGRTIFQGRSQAIRVISDPPGAEIIVNGARVSSTPAEISIRRASAVVLRLEKDGYDPFDVKMERNGAAGYLTEGRGSRPVT